LSPVGALALSLALHFEPSPASPRPEVAYTAVLAGHSVTLSDTGVALLLPSGTALTVKLPRSRLEAEQLLPGVSNYYNGPESPLRRTGVPHFARMHYRSVFQGIDLVVYGSEGAVEYDWIVKPGGDPALIHFSFPDCRAAHIDSNGDLVLPASGGEVRHRRPLAYQIVNGVKRRIESEFVNDGRGGFGFRLGVHDRHAELVIDPTLIFASGFGGQPFVPLYQALPTPDTGTGIALDGQGNIYVTGFSSATQLPFVNASGPAPAACDECPPAWQFVAKISPDGKTLLYSTFIAQNPPALAGATGYPTGRSIAADAAGNVYTVGSTTGANFPSLNGQPVTTAGGSDAYVVKLDPTGRLTGTILLGGRDDDYGNAIALGADGALYVTGATNSSDFPTTPGAYLNQPPTGGQSVFLVKLKPAAISGATPADSAIVYSTYLGQGSAPLVATDPSNNAYVSAESQFWPGTTGVFQSAPPPKTNPYGTINSRDNIVLAKVNASGTKVLYATYFDGSGDDSVRGLAVDAQGSVYLTGYTSSPDLPTTSGSLQPSPPLSISAAGSTYSAGFVARFSPDASSLIYSTYLGGTGLYDYGYVIYASWSAYDSSYALAIDAAGNAYIGGTSQSADFPIRSGQQDSLENWVCYYYFGPSSTTPLGDTYCSSGGTLTVLNPQGSAIVWSTFLGSGAVMDVALGSAGNVYATGANLLLQGAKLGGASNSIGVVKLAPQATPVQFAWDGLTNSASFHPGLPGPGGLASLFVTGVPVSGTLVTTENPLPDTLAGVSILVDGKPAPILAVADLGPSGGIDRQQINFQVPFEAPVITDPSQPHLVEVRYGGLSTFISPQNVGPGIFVLPDGTPAIQHAADYSPVTASNPVTKGETIIVYATGLGSVDNGPATGMPATGAAPMSGHCGAPAATIAAPLGTTPSIFGAVGYAGLTPGAVGLYQLNITTSPNLPSGDVELRIEYYQCWRANGGDILPPANYYQSNTVLVPVR